ncbi:L-lactate dehydrogenase [Alcanivorax venustensis ISO4]|uniref:L-lactate dehydrogenase n=1 Tax=Alloalcanivorax venustensis ISO4 TaxID=1177184 RepID=A0ABS0AFL1_9GAMM|nr:L-lactate dehydrogenase [Alloalcanivorax venustensis ISO4]
MVLKGILAPEDAREAVRFGADGIVVSNHGGRQLDGVLSSARALPAIADAVQGDLTILADSGVRSGLDVVRLLALGADGVLLGRAFVYALAAAGEQGVAQCAGPDRQRDEGGDDAHRGQGDWGDFAGEFGAGGWLRPV